MSKINIIEVNGKSSRREFIKFPWKIYREDPNWVPPLLLELKNQLNPAKNPFFKSAKVKYWIALQDGNTVGRIAGIINHNHNTFYREHSAFFGYFDSINDQQVAEALFEKVSKWAREEGMNKVLGPINLSTDNEAGLLIKGFNQPPVLQMTYNPRYYIDLIEQFGFEKEIDLLAFEITDEIFNNTNVMGKLKQISDVVTKKAGLTFRTFNMSDFENEVERVRILFNDYMSDNWGFVPINKANFDFMAKAMKQILIQDLAFFAEVDGVPIGFSIALPDINPVLKKMNGKLFPLGIFKYLYYKNKIDTIRIMLMGVSKPYRLRGLESVFYFQTIMVSKKRGIKRAELSWISERNRNMVNALNKLNAKQYKEYRIYRKSILL